MVKLQDIDDISFTIIANLLLEIFDFYSQQLWT